MAEFELIERLRARTAVERADVRLGIGDDGAVLAVPAHHDLVVSTERNKKVEFSAFGGYEFRGQADGLDAPSGALRWGAGAGFPAAAAHSCAASPGAPSALVTRGVPSPVARS